MDRRQRSSTPESRTCKGAKSDVVTAPIVLIPGNMGEGSSAVGELNARGLHAIDAQLGPVSSCHDRACEIFYALIGGRVDYGAAHALEHGHQRFGRTVREGSHPSWSERDPVLLVCHSQGATAALTLVALLGRASFFEGFRTNASWVAGVVTVASPLAGVSWIHTLPLVGVPPPGKPFARALLTAEGADVMRE